MIGRRTTYRMADGIRVPGTWRHAFICNGGSYFLTDLFVYADGLIDCWGLVTVEEFQDKLESGWVATSFPDGAEASAHDLAAWTFSEPRAWLTPEMLVAEVRDSIDELNGRPDSTGRCLAAVDAFLEDRTEEKRAVVRAAYLAIPESMRRYALGDMDYKDGPLQVLVAGPGGRTLVRPDEYVTQAAYDTAIAYFEDRARWMAQRAERVPADGPATSHAPAINLPAAYPHELVADPGKPGLRNEYPAAIVVGDITYSCVTHAYWALSVAEPEVHDTIVQADTIYTARSLAIKAARRGGWQHARTAVMTRLLRAKYTQHPDLAEVLLATEDATLLYFDGDSAFWGDQSPQGRNWMGRLLELVRSELFARRDGIEGIGS